MKSKWIVLNGEAESVFTSYRTSSRQRLENASRHTFETATELLACSRLSAEYQKWMEEALRRCAECDTQLRISIREIRKIYPARKAYVPLKARNAGDWQVPV